MNITVTELRCEEAQWNSTILSLELHLGTNCPGPLASRLVGLIFWYVVARYGRRVHAVPGQSVGVHKEATLDGGDALSHFTISAWSSGESTNKFGHICQLC